MGEGKTVSFKFTRRYQGLPEGLPVATRGYQELPGATTDYQGLPQIIRVYQGFPVYTTEYQGIAENSRGYHDSRYLGTNSPLFLFILPVRKWEILAI